MLAILSKLNFKYVAKQDSILYFYSDKQNFSSSVFILITIYLKKIKIRLYSKNYIQTFTKEKWILDSSRDISLKFNILKVLRHFT